MYTLGIPDEEFIRGKVPMTKQEIRILTIVKAGIKRDSLVCDIGAGTGSLSIEAAIQAPEGRVYALERNPEGIGLIKANAGKFGVDNLEIIEACAPDGMEQLPLLDAAIIGGSGGNLAPIMDLVDSKLKVGGRIVINCITIQTIAQCIEYLRNRKDYSYDAVQVQVSQLHQLGSYDMVKANNPIFIVTCIKK
ncbi:MAG: precorrin-6Y C5,15-methyltransferase (decarboxylating) subunit CbiT [Anaerovibrio sp.]|uniref:precorrin-6Y C5,15-methyltransferase (decarboxylating) subunit CbiT n=1 Tax=Anaerovibrio sp. TaxID=1872532 RepID=UPI0025E3F920|nr:precorrin-6Y C5,15-methyltransferase (decarboxylating) subunit CbiT [Anaerovibrio sp.]MCR5177257.1 precorrin-6Y C5,15-methyltransferase (decarboxylating) subunit CbiT [Anaerovibrio sp.]